MPKTKRTTIDNYSLLHFIQRAQERYGKTLTEKDYTVMNGSIRQMKSALIEPLGSDTSTEIYRVIHEGTEYVCVWHKTDNHITTLLPADTKVKQRK